ncbi:MAG TPA: homoserine O-acetyltransferase [Thermodesulfobacteriota bacterium]|nr:homoserine O-acetyltransferase [Thermodesulfobacteriota bacterium]
MVRTERVVLPGPVRLQGGESLPEVTVAYETYGRLAPGRDNAVLVAHALSGGAHAAGYLTPDDPKPGWWDVMIGPGKPIDTERYFVLCSNVLGGCYGTTGPASVDPRTGRPYALRFPLITIRDMVDVQARLLDALGVPRLLAVVGGSMGGMQALQWLASYPARVDSAIAIATSLRHTAMQIAFNEVGRRAITSDPNWNDGDYYGSVPPAKGLAVARMLGHITYLSTEVMEERFGRRQRGPREKFRPSFEVEHYLHHQGEAFVNRFDANSYLYITTAIDTFDWHEEVAPLDTALRGVLEGKRALVLSFSSDWLYPTAQAAEIARALEVRGMLVSRHEVRSTYGHDAFLLEVAEQGPLVREFLATVAAARPRT